MLRFLSSTANSFINKDLVTKMVVVTVIYYVVQTFWNCSVGHMHCKAKKTPYNIAYTQANNVKKWPNSSKQPLHVPQHQTTSSPKNNVFSGRLMTFDLFREHVLLVDIISQTGIDVKCHVQFPEVPLFVSVAKCDFLYRSEQDVSGE